MLTTPLQTPEIKILDDPGRFRIVGLIGYGEMGYVYEAMDTRTSKRLAIKTLRDKPSTEDYDRFRLEIVELATLQDAHIVSILNIGECEQDHICKPYLLMPFLEGTTLESMVAPGERVPVERCVKIVLQVCQGLRAAHEKEIIHRDIKPSNVFVQTDGGVKIIDFGLARLFHVRASPGRLETFQYMSPEQVVGEQVDKRSDLFSLGVVLYQLLTNNHPFFSESHTDRTEIDFEKPPLAKDFNPDIDDSLCCLVHKSLQQDRRFRFQTAGEMVGELQKLLDKKPLDFCDLGRMEPWLTEAAAALQRERPEEAADRLDDLAGRGYWHPRIDELREEIDRANAKTKSAHDFLLSEYEDAESLMEAKKLTEAVALCERVLGEYPDDVRFQVLLTTIKYRQIEIRSADIAAITGRVNNEPDLTGKIEILEAGLRLYPEEPRLLEAIGSARELLQVVSAEGMQPRLQEQLRQNAKVSVIEEVRHHLGEGAFELALHLIESARAFHGDPELEQLRRESQHGMQHEAQTQDLCDQAAIYIQKQNYDDAIPLLEKAWQLDPDHSRAGRLLLECLYSLANLHPHDSKTAEELLRRISEVDRKSEKARALDEVVQDRKRNEFISQTMATADKLRLQGLLGKAVTVLEEGLRVYPDDRRMSRHLEETRKLWERQQREESNDANPPQRYPDDPQLPGQRDSASPGLDSFAKSEADSETVAEIKRLQSGGTIAKLQQALSLTTKGLADQPGDLELLHYKNQLVEQLNDEISLIEGRKERIQAYIERKDFEAALALIQQAIVADPADPSLGKLKKQVRRRLKFEGMLGGGRLQVAGAAILLVLLVVAGYGTFAWIRQPKAPFTIQVSIASEPSGAHVVIGNQEGNTPLLMTMEVLPTDQNLTYEIKLPDYIPYQGTLLLEPNTTSYVIAPVALKLAGRPPVEVLYERVSETAARLNQTSYREAGFLNEVDQFVSGVNQLQTMDPSNSEIHDKVAALKNDLKTHLAATFENLPFSQKTSEKAIPLLSALGRIDPDDPQAKTWMGAYPAMIGTLKTAINTAIQKRTFLTSDAGGALSLLESLQSSFPSEAAYSRAKREEIRSAVLAFLQANCQNQTDACTEYGQRALKDFANDKDRILRVVGNAPPLPKPPPPTEPSAPVAPPSTPPVSAPDPHPAPPLLDGTIKEMLLKMTDAFNDKRYVLPRSDSSATFASEILGLARANPGGIGPDTKALLDRAETGFLNSLSFAEQEANSSTKSYAEALLSRDKAVDVQKKFVRAREIWEVIGALKNTPELLARLGMIDSRLSDLQELLNATHSYLVKVDDGRGGACNGTLTIDGFSLNYRKSIGRCENFVKKFDDIQPSQNQTTVELISTQTRDRWVFEDDMDKASRPAREQKAKEIVDTIGKLAKLRERFNKQ